jgi:adenine-specific DNA-methyltransferase
VFAATFSGMPAALTPAAPGLRMSTFLTLQSKTPSSASPLGEYVLQTYDDLPREALIEILKRRDRERKLGLVWERQDIEKDGAINSDFLILDEDANLSYVERGPSANLVIEGDNYDALRWLRTTRRGSIKFIYIDPPYNTGSKTFVYNDNYVDPEDKYRHSKWLEFMYQRLVLARDLMTADGLIFVSIDDTEMARLRLLMDIVFPGNFQACLVWQSDGTGDNQGAFKIKHEYILVYSRDKSQMLPPPVLDPNLAHDSKLFNDEKRNSIIKNGPKNPISEVLIPAGFPAGPAFISGTIQPRSGDKEWPKHSEPIVVENSVVQHEVRVRSGWSSKTLLERFISQGFVPVLDDKNQLTSFEITKTGAIEYFKPRQEGQSYVVSVIRNVGSVQKTKSELSRIGVLFDYPKPVGLIEYLLQMVPGNDFTALDFFAGTGTTAEAVARLNARDRGTRKFIMVSSTEATQQEPEKNICRDACRKRLATFFKNETTSVTIPSALAGFRYTRIIRVRTGDIDQALLPDKTWAWLQLLTNQINWCSLSHLKRVPGFSSLTALHPKQLSRSYNSSMLRLHFCTPGLPGDLQTALLVKALKYAAFPKFF